MHDCHVYNVIQMSEEESLKTWINIAGQGK